LRLPYSMCLRRGKGDVLIVGRDSGRRHGSSRVGIHFNVMKRERRVVVKKSSNALEVLEDGDFQGNLGVSLYLLSTHGGLFVEFLKEFWGIEVIVVDSAVISSWVPFLMDEVLEFMSSSMSSCISNVFYFVFIVILFHYWRGSDIVCAI